VVVAGPGLVVGGTVVVGADSLGPGVVGLAPVDPLCCRSRSARSSASHPVSQRGTGCRTGRATRPV